MITVEFCKNRSISRWLCIKDLIVGTGCTQFYVSIYVLVDCMFFVTFHSSKFLFVVVMVRLAGLFPVWIMLDRMRSVSLLRWPSYHLEQVSCELFFSNNSSNAFKITTWTLLLLFVVFDLVTRRYVEPYLHNAS